MMNNEPQMMQYDDEFTMEERNWNYYRSLVNLFTYIGIFFVATNFVAIVFLIVYARTANLPFESLYDAEGNLIQGADLFVNSWTNFTVYIFGTSIIVLLSWRFLKLDFYKTKQNWSAFFVFVLQGIGIYLVSNIISNFIMTLLGISDEATNQKLIEEMIFSNYVILILITTILLAPIVEELVFRKSIFHLFERKRKLSPTFIIIISGLLFGSIHIIVPIINVLSLHGSAYDVYLEFIHIIPYFISGAALALIYVLSKRNILVTITMHFINNILATLLIFFMPQI